MNEQLQKFHEQIARRHERQTNAPGPQPKPRGKPRGKLPEAAILKLLKTFPIGKRNPDGSLIKDKERIEALEKDRITIARTTLVHRLRPYRQRM